MDGSTLPTTSSPWHDGEREAQRRAGTAERMERYGGRVIRAFMPDQHRQFFAQLPFVIVGSVDRQGLPWASLLAGPPGFVQSPDDRTLRVAALPASGDQLAGALTRDARLGILGIELSTRRRNRANGHVAAVDASGFTLAVEQSFGNCPQYIQLRETLTQFPPRTVEVETFVALDDAVRALIAASDTMFVATAAAPGPAVSQGVDVSHRGGRPGFVDVAPDGTISVPDFPGNGFFNTIGNLVANPRAGLLFIDFASGDLLQVAGEVEIVWGGPSVEAFPGAERLWRLKPVRGRWLRGAFPQRLALRDRSPQALAMGIWAEATTPDRS